MMAIVWVLAILLIAFVSLFFFLQNKVVKHRPTTFPRKAEVPHAKAIGKITITCTGDSITHGNVSVNYVDMLQRWFGEDFYFYNAGVNSDLSYTLLQRLDDIIATQPQFITVLIGTNDVNATVSPESLKRYRKFRKITPAQAPNFESYKQNLAQIVDRLTSETTAKIALLSLPIMGEALDNEANQKADKYSEFIKQLAHQKHLTYLPLRERMKDFLRQHPKTLKYQYKDTIKLLYTAIIKHEVLGQDWDTICKAHGMDLTQDNLHFNTRGAAMITSLIEKWLKSYR